MMIPSGSSVVSKQSEKDSDTMASEHILESDALGTSILTSSARGLWKYTVGLVGKPSAGKLQLAILLDSTEFYVYA
jgi:hypothetical protein